MPTALSKGANLPTHTQKKGCVQVMSQNFSVSEAPVQEL